ncbi:MAG: FtsX-like permease family protein [Bacteroidota bacterium]
MGAQKSVLIRQFLGESFMMCIIALALALTLAWALLPLFNNLTQKKSSTF